MIEKDFQDYKRLKVDLLNMYNQYGTESKKLPKIQIKDKAMSNQDQRDYYENTIQTLKEKFTKNIQIH